jgi:hypothetical protein
MTLLGWLWLASPFALIALISRDQRLQRLVSSHYGRCRAAGLAGAAMMVLGAILIPTALGKVMFALGTPLTGLVVFLCRDDGDEGGQDEPDVPPVDWDEFERSFSDHVRRHSPHR